MTEEELDDIRARAEAATPGPWTIRAYRHGYQWHYFCNSPSVPPLFPESRFYHGFGGIVFAVESPNMSGGDSFKETDREFVAHAREDIPRLLDEIERLQNELKRLRGDM